ncbi:MAG: flavodoxin [Mariniphaga sp.]|nr:flavodoxin [Mariniphaga sp.]
MKTAIIFTTNHGATEKVAHLIGETLKNNSVEYFNLKNNPKIDLADFDTIVIGSSIHAGKNQSEVRKFIKNDTLKLLQMKIALYLCCMNQPQEQAEFEIAYPELLRKHSVYNAIVGGEYAFEKMNFIEKFLVRKISGVSSTTSKLRYTEINNLVNSIDNENSI